VIITREELKYHFVDAISRGWADIGSKIGYLVGKEKKFRSITNNPDGSCTLDFEAYIFTWDEYKNEKGFAYYKEAPKEEKLSGLIMLYIAVMSLSTLIWMFFK
jgi:hypothetical protein